MYSTPNYVSVQVIFIVNYGHVVCLKYSLVWFLTTCFSTSQEGWTLSITDNKKAATICNHYVLGKYNVTQKLWL